jgi:hypothetical protein
MRSPGSLASHARLIGVITTDNGRSDAANRTGRFAGSLPWLVVCAWLIGALIAFWFFDLRAPQRFMCGG